MDSLTALDHCLQAALRDIAPAPAEPVVLSDALGAVLAEPLIFPCDMPPTAQALRDGFAVASLELTGASSGVPVALGAPLRVLPADPLPPGTDAVLPQDGVEITATGCDAIRSVGPGHGVRRAGHDGRAGTLMAPAGTFVSNRLGLVAALAGLTQGSIRRPRVAVELPDLVQARFACAFLTGLGATIVTDAPRHLILRAAVGSSPCLALAPGETAWLGREGAALVLSVPRRFDGMVAACLALGVPAMAALTGSAPLSVERPLTRKLASALGMADLVLLTRQGASWHPGPTGAVTLAGLAAADAFAILPPDSEGLPVGAPLAGISLSSPFG